MLAGKGLFGRFAYLAATQFVIAPLGLLFWTLATHFIPASQVGVAAAASSTALFIYAVGMLGVGTLFVAELQQTEERDRRPIVTTGLIVVAATVVVLALGTLVLAPVLGQSLRTVARDPALAALFVVGAAASGMGEVLDSASVGLRRSPVSLLRNSVLSFGKLALLVLLVALGFHSGASLLLAWVTALLVSLYVSARRMRSALPGDAPIRLSERVKVARRLWSLSLNHHVLNIAITSISYLLPVLAAILVAPSDVAYFTTAQLVASVPLIIPAMLALTLFAEATGDHTKLRSNIRKTLPVGLAGAASIVAIVEVSAGFIMRIFGSAYAEHGAPLLRILVLVGIPYVIKDHYMAIRRSQRRLRDAARTAAAGTVAEITAAAVGGVVWGLKGLCVAWAATTCCEAILLGRIVFQAAARLRVYEWFSI